jgi:hypothetical protein
MKRVLTCLLALVLNSACQPSRTTVAPAQPVASTAAGSYQVTHYAAKGDSSTIVC